MERVIQCVEIFYAPGTCGASDGTKTIENVIRRVNSDGWRVDQIVPLFFRSPTVGEGMDATSGILLCSKIQ